MASLMENLIDVLYQECTEYEGLLVLSRKKTPIIAGANLEELQKITDDEQNVVIRINHLEKQRVEVTKDIANVLNRDVDSLKLTNLIDMLAGRPAEQEKLAAVHDRLQTAVRSLQLINEQNKELLTNALEMGLDNMVYGLVVLFLVSYVADMVINTNRQAVEFTIFSGKWAEIADAINNVARRGCTVITAEGWYSKKEVKMLIVMCRKIESVSISRIIKSIDPNAFVTQANVNGVYGQGFDELKVKVKKNDKDNDKDKKQIENVAAGS